MLSSHTGFKLHPALPPQPGAGITGMCHDHTQQDLSFLSDCFLKLDFFNIILIFPFLKEVHIIEPSVFMDFESADLINCRSRIFRKKSCLY
jgi:hypothetical protein